MTHVHPAGARPLPPTPPAEEDSAPPVLAGALAEKPAMGFPRALSEAELSAYYRFVNNDCVTFDELLGAHQEATKRRAERAGWVIVAHDTTDFRFSEEVPREGLELMDNG